ELEGAGRRRRCEHRVEGAVQPTRSEVVFVRRRPDRAQPPERERPHHGLELQAVWSQLVNHRRRGRLKPVLRHQTAPFQLLEPRRQDVRPDPRQARGEVRIALRALEQLPHDQERPAFPDQAEGVGHRAVLVVALAHAPSVARRLAVVKERLAKSKWTVLGCKPDLLENERKVDDMVASDRRKWLALALLSVVQFMVVLDIAIVNVALPSIQVDLGFSERNLQWVISAYALVFGGFLLLGGRAADLLGRRRIFLVGIVVFTVSSLLAGLAWSEASLIGARAFQGLGAAVITPAALSILSTTFTEGRERTIALGVWGAVGGFGAAAGVWLGFILGTATFSLFLMLTLYMQQVLGYSPMKTGVAYLAVAGGAIFTSAIAAQLVTRIGVKPALVIGMTSLTAGLVYFTQVSVHGS